MMKLADGVAKTDVVEDDKPVVGTADLQSKEIEEDSRSAYAEFELPLGHLDNSGVLFDKVVLREMTGEEEDVFASRKLSVIKKINKVLSNCIKEFSTKDALKKISDPLAIEEIVSRMPSIDRMFMLVRIRQQSYGDMFKFEFTCQNQVEDDKGIHPCGYKQSVSVNLGELDIKIPADKKKRVFQCKLSSGKVAEFKIMTGVEDAQLAIGNDEKTLSDIMMMRIIKYDNRPVMLKDLKKMPLRERKKLRDEMSKADEAGMDSTIEIECAKCHNIVKDTLRFDSADFFYPEGQ